MQATIGTSKHYDSGDIPALATGAVRNIEITSVITLSDKCAYNMVVFKEPVRALVFHAWHYTGSGTEYSNISTMTFPHYPECSIGTTVEEQVAGEGESDATEETSETLLSAREAAAAGGEWAKPEKEYVNT